MVKQKKDNINTTSAPLKKSDGYFFVNFPQNDDERGSLCFSENTNLPFEIKRVFWIFGVKKGKTRGGHAHKTCAEIVIPVCGKFDITVDDGEKSDTFTMDSPNQGIYIAPNVWCNLENFSDNAVCVVLASHEYIPEGYINDYDTFKNSKA